MWYYAISIICIIIIGALAFYVGRINAPKNVTESKTTTFLIKSIQAIAELAVLEYITEGVAEIKDKEDQSYHRTLEEGIVEIYGKAESRLRPGTDGLYC